MNRIYCLLLVALFVSCKNSQKQSELTVKDCDNTKLVSYFLPISNFSKERILVYSLSSNRDSLVEINKKHHKLHADKDSLMTLVSKNMDGRIVDSIMYKMYDGIPKLHQMFSEVEFYPKLIQTKKTITGNRFCEFSTFKDILEYTILPSGEEVHYIFEGYVTHTKYVTKEFKGKEYNCAIYESEKELTVTSKANIEKMKGTAVSCGCENLGEIYSKVTLENGQIVEQKLIDIIEN
jgi:hypothetical protein